ncbi:MAG: motility associated factor glycosyltransferase family protein [Phycisphaerales bacterium]|nr:motility associated factor glycosyltransferase family protein [Phycisphaerales bacterium]
MNASADPSYRYILDPQAPYLRNLAALWATDPDLARQVEAIEESYTVEPSKSGEPTVAVTGVEGRKIHLHSRYQPLDEAKRLIGPMDASGCMAFHVHGFGLGYHVEQLFEKISTEGIIAVLEPDIRLLRTAFEHRDLSQLIASKRIYFFTEPNKTQLLVKLTSWAAMFTMGFEKVEHAPSIQARPDFYAQMQGWIDDFLAYCRTNMNTLVLNGKRTAENLARNIGWYAATPGLGRLAGRYRGMPAVIVSAGPSLRKNKHLLKGLEDNAVIIAVQTTLQPLLEMGIEPHFVTSLDYHEICTRFFEKLPATLRTELVAEPKAARAIFNMMPGPITLLGSDYCERLLCEHQLNRPRLNAGATVAHLGYYLAEHLQCDPIVFVGQDLGFSDGLCYTPGTSYEEVWRPELSRFYTLEMKQWEQIVRDRPILRRIPDQQGRPMYTEERLFTYLQQFERDFATTRATIIDASEGGAQKRGAKVMKLADVIEQYCTKPVNRLEDHPGLDWSTLGRCIVSIEKRRSEAGQIGEIAQNTLPLLEEIRDHLDDQQRVNRTIARIDLLRARMNELGQCYELISQLMQNTELDRFQQDRKIEAEKVEGIERQRRQVQRDVDNVRGVIEASGGFVKLMDDVLTRLVEMQQRHPVGRAA